MKKYIGLVIVTLFTLTACSDKKEKEIQKSIPETHTESPKPVPQNNPQPEPVSDNSQDNYVPVQAPESDAQNGYKTMPAETTQLVESTVVEPTPEPVPQPEPVVQQPEISITEKPTSTNANQDCTVGIDNEDRPILKCN